MFVRPASQFRARRAFLRVLVWLMGGTLIAAAQTQRPASPNAARDTVRATRIHGAIDLTGRLSDPLWKLAQPVRLSYEVDPGENTPAPQATFAYVLYNNEYLYIGLNCLDTHPDEIRAHISDRDKIYEDDFAGILLDTYGDGQRYYEFFSNPFGIQADALGVGSEEDQSFDTVWESAAAISDSGWTAELAIPFKSLRFHAVAEQPWRIHFGRFYPRETGAILSWMPLSRNDPCLMCQSGALAGIRDIELTSSVEILPYAAIVQGSGLEDTEDPATKFERGRVHGRAGGGIRYAPTPNLAVDAVVNPDFSQVESDAEEISVNSSFAIFYPEKRPFFQHGADQFRTRISAFYSRMINDPLGAAKVTGKYGGLSIGYLSAYDRHTPFLVPGEEESSLEESSVRSLSNVLRARYDLGDESFVGGILTTRNMNTAHNYVGGLDWNYRFWENWYVRGQALASQTKELNDPSIITDIRTFGSTSHTAMLDGEFYRGTALEMIAGQSAREYSFNIGLHDLSPTFQAQDGSVSRVNQRMMRTEAEYYVYPTESFIDRAFLHGETGLEFNYDGVRKERWAVIVAGLLTKGQTSVQAGGLVLNQEQYQGVYFPHIERSMFEFNTYPWSSLSFHLEGEIGKFIYRDEPTELGTGHNLELGVTVKPTTQLSVDLSYSRARLKSIATGGLLYDGYIARSVAAYQFTRTLFLRLIGQYNSFDRIVDIYPLISYKLNPFTIFYAGSTYSLTDFDDYTRYNFRQTQRQFFIKFQYLIRS